MKKMLFILNPYAGKCHGAKHLAKMIEIFNRADYAVTVHITAGHGDAEEVAAQRGGEYDLIACCGGDGTFNETIAGLLRGGFDVPVGYIPAGSTNDLAASLGLSTDNLQAARDIVEGTVRQVDVGLFGDRYFSYVASFGAFTRVSYATSQSMKNMLGHTAYVLSGIKELAHIKRVHLRFELEDGEVLEDDYIFGAVSNTTSLAGLLTLPAELVDMCDGKLEIMLLKMPKNLVALASMANALRKHNYSHPSITFLNATSVKVTAPEDMDWTLDGEQQPGVTQTQIRCVPQAVRLVVKDKEKEKEKEKK